MDDDDADRIFHRALDELDLQDDWDAYWSDPDRDPSEDAAFKRDMKGKVANWWRENGMSATEPRMEHMGEAIQRTSRQATVGEFGDTVPTGPEPTGGDPGKTRHPPAVLKHGANTIERNYKVNFARANQKKGEIVIQTRTNKVHRIRDYTVDRHEVSPNHTWYKEDQTVVREVLRDADTGQFITQRKVTL